MRLEKAPLVHVLAQVVFSELQHLRESIPEFQAHLLDLGFPWVQEGAVHHVSITSEGPPRVEALPRWDFLSADRTAGVAVTKNWLVLQTTSYQTATPFRETLCAVAAALQTTAVPRFVQRIGLRYVDLVRPDEKESFEQYVTPGVLGFPFNRMGDKAGASGGLVTQAAAATPAGMLVVRSSVVPAGQPVPSDLLPTQLRYPPSAISPRPALALDFDHVAEFTEAFSFDPAAIGHYLERLRDASHAAFEVVGTPYAFERWGPWIRESVT